MVFESSTSNQLPGMYQGEGGFGGPGVTKGAPRNKIGKGKRETRKWKKKGIRKRKGKKISGVQYQLE